MIETSYLIRDVRRSQHFPYAFRKSCPILKKSLSLHFRVATNEFVEFLDHLQTTITSSDARQQDLYNLPQI